MGTHTEEGTDRTVRGKDILAVKGMTDRLAMVIENIVDYMGVSTTSGNRGLNRYNGIVPFLPEVFDAMGGDEQESLSEDESRENGELFELLQRIAPPAAFDMSMLNIVTGVGEDSRYKWAATRIRRVNAKQARGATICVPDMFESWTAIVKKDATFIEGRQFLAWMNGRWRWASPRAVDPTIELQAQRNAGLAVWLYGELRDSWQISLGYDESPRVRFCTTAEGVLESFRLRDIPNGKTRRAALVHWVEKHWRTKKPTTPDAESTLIEVRKHLRGARTFSWNGLSCEITPIADFAP